MDPREPLLAGATVRCHQCGHEVPALEYCIVCGHALADEIAGRAGLGGRFAAAPEEPAGSVRLFSTLFPQLPRAELDAFRLSLALGVGAIVVLIALGQLAVAFIGAVVLVPLLVSIYLYEVDIYEDEPWPVLALTLAWGLAAGIATGLLLRALDGALASAVDPAPIAAVLLTTIALPIVELVLITLGPLWLMRRRRFNDVLDGATFGALSGAAFAAGSALGSALDLLATGTAVVGDVNAWIPMLLTTAVARPVLYAGAGAGVAAALWLRYRSSVTDRRALGVVGRPVPAAIFAALMLSAAHLAGVVLPPLAALVMLTAIAILGLVWLRRAIHLGLLQEARERDIGAAATCLNCGRASPVHSFCGHCGIALAALPKRSRRRTSGTEEGVGDA